MGDFRNKYPADCFRGKKIYLARKYIGKKYPELKKLNYLSWHILKQIPLVGQNISGCRALEKKLNQTKSPIPPPPPKSKMVDP